MCQNSLPPGGVGHLEPKFQGEEVVPEEYFFDFYKTRQFCYLTVQTAQCCVPSFWHNTVVCRTDARTDARTDRRNLRSKYSDCNVSIAARCKNISFLANVTSRSLGDLTFTFAMCYRPSVCCLSVCLSECLSCVTFVRPTQAVQIFGNIFKILGTLAIRWHPLKISRRSSQGNPSAGGVKHTRGSQV